MQEAIHYSRKNKDCSYTDGAMTDAIRRLITERAREKDIAWSELSKLAGKSHSYIQQFIRRGVPSSLPEDVRPAIAAALGIEEDDLRPAGAGTRRKVQSSATRPAAAVDLWPEHAAPASIPEIDVLAGGGFGGGFGQEIATTDRSGHQISADAVRSTWGIPIPFLREELRANPDRVHILAIRGDSMMESLFDGDRAIVNLDDTDVSQGGIFALVDDIGSVIIKQVELVRGGQGRRIKCTSRNPNYEPFELQLEDPVRIIGRVAGKITRL